MLSEAQQTMLTRVGAGTPMGTLLRRYWHPVAASVEMPPRTARRVRLLGEDLVLFRTASGTLGLVEEHCPHRGASLAYGCVDETLRCPYHGLAFAPSGVCVEVPFARPQDTAGRPGPSARAYPVDELGGLAFAYLGPDPAPLLPRFDLFVWEGVLRDVGRARIPCNWLQIMENSVDPIHVEWLHGHHLAAVRSAAGAAPPTHYPKRHVKIGFSPFPFGIIKRRVLEGGSEDDDDWRIGHPLVFPNMVRVGAHGQHRLQIRVPVDDTHTDHYWYACYRPPPGIDAGTQDHVPVYDVPFHNAHGDHALDFVDGGDIMTWVTQGAIADRTREHLLPSDEGVVLLRRMLVEQLERLQRGEDPIGIVRDAAENVCIELPQERQKYGDGAAFLREALELSHVRYSPLRDRLRDLFRA